MRTVHDQPRESLPPPQSPPRAVKLVGALTALWCLGFAVVNVVFELSDRFSSGPYAAYASGLTVMNWLVIVLKLLGAVVSLLSIADRARWPSPATLGVLLWGAFSTIGVYAAGSLVQAIGMASGLMGDPGDIDVAGVAYVLFFLAAAVGFGILAVSHSRRHGLRKRVAMIGMLGAPAMLLVILVVMPALLVGLGIMPADA